MFYVVTKRPNKLQIDNKYATISISAIETTRKYNNKTNAGRFFQ